MWLPFAYDNSGSPLKFFVVCCNISLPTFGQVKLFELLKGLFENIYCHSILEVLENIWACLNNKSNGVENSERDKILM